MRLLFLIGSVIAGNPTILRERERSNVSQRYDYARGQSGASRKVDGWKVLVIATRLLFSDDERRYRPNGATTRPCRREFPEKVERRPCTLGAAAPLTRQGRSLAFRCYPGLDEPITYSRVREVLFTVLEGVRVRVHGVILART